MTPYTPEEVRDIAGVLQDIAHDLPKELEDRIVLMLECYASDLDARVNLGQRGPRRQGEKQRRHGRSAAHAGSSSGASSDVARWWRSSQASSRPFIQL